MSDERKLTDDEAKVMLDALSKHFGEPVMPIGRYCDGLRTWQQALHDRADRLKVELFPGIDGLSSDPKTEAAFEAYKSEMASAAKRDRYARSTAREYKLDGLRNYQQEAERVGAVFLQIRKSALLYRLLYFGEALRTEMCPTHKGKWAGCFGECKHGCGLTGWLPKAPP